MSDILESWEHLVVIYSLCSPLGKQNPGSDLGRLTISAALSALQSVARTGNIIEREGPASAGN